MNTSANNPPADRKHQRSKIEWIIFLVDVMLWACMAIRLIDPLFLDGQLLPSMALAFLPGSLLFLLGISSLGAHRVFFAFGLIGFMFWDGSIDLSSISHTLQQIHIIGPALLLMLLIPLLCSMRWYILLRGQGITMPLLESFRLVMIGLFFNQFIPGSTGGDLYRIYAARAAPGGDSAKATITVILDRFLGLPPLVLVLLISYLSNWDFISTHATFRQFGVPILIVCGISVLLFAYLLFGAVHILSWAKRIENRIPAGKQLVKISEAIASYRSTPWSLVAVFLIGFVMHTVTVLACLLFARASGISIPWLLYFFLVPLGLSINFLPLAPGGIGQGEKAFSYLFSAVDPEAISEAQGASVMVCFRLGLLLLALLGGILYAFGRRKSSAHPEDCSSELEVPNQAKGSEATDVPPLPEQPQ